MRAEDQEIGEAGGGEVQAEVLHAAGGAEQKTGGERIAIEAEESGDRLSRDELLSAASLILGAGFETTVNLIGNGMLTLIDHPEERARLRNDPELIDSAVEELLRFTSPVACGATRYALEDVELSGVKVPKGAQVLGMIISANRDDEVFERPDTLDVGRHPNRHIAFAFGPHYCLGNQLARLEGRFAINALVGRFPDVSLAISRGEVRYKPTPSLRGPSALPLQFGQSHHDSLLSPADV
jgi:cytochrome P450 PksS